MQNYATPPTTCVDGLEDIHSASSSTIRLLVLDIDGTISGESNQVNTAVLDAIRDAQAQGIGVAIATGRMYRSALRFHQLIGSTLPLICYQGALIQDPQTHQIHRHWSVPPALAQNLLDYFHQRDLRSQVSIHLYVNDQLYVAEMNALTEDYAQRSQITPNVVDSLVDVARQSPTKVLVLSADPSLTTQVFNDLRRRIAPSELYLTRSVPTFFEATHPSANKGTAVRYLAEKTLQLSATQVMAIGDNWNDLEMLAYVGLGVAMGSAPDAVKEVATWVAPDVEKDGVAATIQRFLLC